MKIDHGCNHDVEQEQAEQAQREAHENETCDGPPQCCYCLDLQERGAESLGG